MHILTESKLRRSMSKRKLNSKCKLLEIKREYYKRPVRKIKIKRQLLKSNPITQSPINFYKIFTKIQL